MIENPASTGNKVYITDTDPFTYLTTANDYKFNMRAYISDTYSHGYGEIYSEGKVIYYLKVKDCKYWVPDYTDNSEAAYVHPQNKQYQEIEKSLLVENVPQVTQCSAHIIYTLVDATELQNPHSELDLN